MTDLRHNTWTALLAVARARREGTSARLPEQADPDLLALYADLARGGSRGHLVVAHLGQSLDGCIATDSGDSVQVTGRANFVHLHRLRALSDAIVVGSLTALSDDPRLSTRLVPGPSPTRVVLDRRGRLPGHLAVFTDGQAETLLVCGEGVSTAVVPEARIVRVPVVDGQLSLPAVRDALARRGLHVLFIEGGGMTVTGFVQAALVDHLHIAVAPVLIGTGRRGIALPPAPDMANALRPGVRSFRMGTDMLWDLDLRQQGSSGHDTADDWPRQIHP